METAIRTLDKLRSLEQLYRQGFRSEVIDRTLDKLLAAEAKRALAERRDLEARLFSRSHAAAWECIRGTFNHSPFSKGDLGGFYQQS
jgi:hypothetical protein